MAWLLGSVIVLLVIWNFFPEKKLPSKAKIDQIIVYKGKRQMEVYSKGVKLKTYTISLGFRPRGRKRFYHDGKTPEGNYFIVTKNNPSIAYKSLGISYPNAEDRKYAARFNKSPGGLIMIHGMVPWRYWGKFHRFRDWTAGCIAVTNNEMDELFRHVKVGCKIEIKK